jgi:hypothetical protein
MSSPSFRRVAAVLVLGLTLLSPWASASGPRARAAHRSGTSAVQVEQGVWGKVWGILASVWSKYGGSLDPDGLLAVSTASTADAGCSADPDGRCVSSATMAGFCDNGMSIDPNGHCVSSANNADAGCSADPNGHCVSGH